MAELTTGLSVGGIVRAALGGDVRLGETAARVNFPVIEVYADGTTNLAEVFPAAFEESEDESSAAVYGEVAATVTATVQYLGEREVEGDEGPPVSVDLDVKKLALAPDAIANDLTLALQINGKSAGTIAATGTADLAGETPAVDEAVTLAGVDLAALSTVAEAAGVPLKVGERVLRLAGTADGSVDVDSANRVVDGTITDQPTSPPFPRTAATGYESSRLVLDLAGGADAAGNVVTIERLALTTDDGTAGVSANVDLAALDTPAGPVAAVSGPRREPRHALRHPDRRRAERRRVVA